ncbi:MAG: hypothetical protein ASARMPREDX12_006744 [Alectoria sarmentosa]|nr:MAG: hypothetical protein ASARMPREDX12_006744 [Alectoria sarmentosa]
MASVSTITPPVAFNTAFERLNEIVSKDDARSFNSTRMEDVWTTARDIERHLESRRSLRGFRRIQPFLAGIEQYSKVVEVICNGTPYMPYLWAPIKLLLQIAQGHIAALEKLIDAYAMIGEAMPRFDRLSAAFKDDLEFQQVMGHFYEDILEFHRRAYMFFRRRAWKIVFDSLWKTFHLRFQGILENLRKHRDLIDAEANAIDIAEAKAWRSTQLDHIRQWRADRAYDIDKSERERLASQTREAAAWFGANEGQEDVFAKFSRACDGSESHWIFKDSIVLSWLGQGGRDNPVVWLNGKPGAGKSVICSKLVEHVQEKTDMAVIYYFCPHHQASQTSASEVLRSFATQLLTGNASLAPYILETFANNGQKPTKKNLGMILEKMITSVSSLRIIVDGLDECLQEDQDEIIQDLLRIKGPASGAYPRVAEEEKRSNVTLCLHELHLYAIDHWVDHLLALSKSLGSHPGGNGLELLVRGLERLTDMHKEVAALRGSSIRNERGSDSTQREHSWQTLEVSPATRSLLDRALVYRESASVDESQPYVPPSSPDELLDPPLFPRIRGRYRTIVEELMAREEPTDKALFDFKVRQNSGAFLCHNQNCPRAVQGFRTSELRQEHEKSHRPRFQCVHAPCGFFGTTFNTRAAMNKHATQYHDEETTASVPDSMIRKSRVSPKDRSLFTFTEPTTEDPRPRTHPPPGYPPPGFGPHYSRQEQELGANAHADARPPSIDYYKPDERFVRCYLG